MASKTEKRKLKLNRNEALTFAQFIRETEHCSNFAIAWVNTSGIGITVIATAETPNGEIIELDITDYDCW
jgi:hypothetical protein